MAGVTVPGDDHAPETVASSRERVLEVDAARYAAGKGPCLEAARTGQVVRVSVQQAAGRWPEFAASARARVRSYRSAPPSIDEKAAGSLNLYSSQPHGLGDLDEALLRLYTTAAVVAISSARRYARARPGGFSWDDLISRQ